MINIIYISVDTFRFYISRVSQVSHESERIGRRAESHNLLSALIDFLLIDFFVIHVLRYVLNLSSARFAVLSVKLFIDFNASSEPKVSLESERISLKKNHVESFTLLYIYSA